MSSPLRERVAQMVGDTVRIGVSFDPDYYCGWRSDAEAEVYEITDAILALVDSEGSGR